MGCRTRASVADLLRIVARFDTSAASAALRPDPRRREAGRGAWVHPDQDCVTKAVQRRAFARALRLSAALDAQDVLAIVGQQALPQDRGSALLPVSTQREGEKKHP